MCPGSAVRLDVGLYGAALDYSWSTGETSPYILVTDPGTYTVQVNGDQINYGESIDVPVSFFPQPEVSIESSDLSCAGSSDGAISIDVVAGAPPFYAEWSTGATGTDLVNLEAGNYQVKIIDDNGCRVVSDILITQPNSVEVNVVMDTSDWVNGNSSVELLVQGGTPPYQFIWEDEALSAPIVEGLGPGEYKVDVIDAHGCSELVQFKIGTVTSIDYVIEDNGLQIYPNPIKHKQLIIQAGLKSYDHLHVMDLSGRNILTRVLTPNQGSMIIDLAELPNGMYLVALEDLNGNAVIRKIVVMD